MSDVHARRPPLRLLQAAYADERAVFSVTIGVRDRTRVFDDHEVAGDTVDVLNAHAAKTGVIVYAYCVMPDHVHILLRASATCDVATFIGNFKSLAMRAAWKRGLKGSFWQSSYYDRCMRTLEEAQAHATYIVANPVRAGLVESWRAWPFSGATAWD